MITTLGVVVTAAAVAGATAYVNRSVPPPPEPTPTPGSGFEPAVRRIPKCGQSYAIGRTLDPQTEAAELLSIDRGGPSFDDFLQRQHASPIGTITIEIVFTGRLQRPTRILDVRVARLETTQNLAGTELRTYCGGDPPARAVELDLDTPPRALISDKKPYFDGRDLDVTVEQRETLRISASARLHGYRWVFAIDHIDGSGVTVTSYLDANGGLYQDIAQVPDDAEFSLTGAAKTYGVRYQESGGRFYQDAS
ncbi:hypothetical protein ACQP26_03305 [Micromonospora sp. CA-248089]|uniref:hypothetical protein n=1 Tax=Micromonospora sp. CA-248089 TaxID=3239960 RepID=UPI003D8C345E